MGTVIGPAGGTVSASGATLVIPAGALSQDVTITVDVASPAATLPDATTIQGMVFDFHPDGTSFSIPATLTLPLPAAPPPGQRAVVSFLETTNNRWVDIAATVDSDRISAPIAHFTPYSARFAIDSVFTPLRQWSMQATKKGAAGWGFPTGISSYGERRVGEVREDFLFGAAQEPFEQDNGETPGIAIGEVYSSDTGDTFSAYAEAPSGDPNIPDFRSGGLTYLRQYQSFVKRSPTASMQVVLTQAFMSISDHNGRPLAIECNGVNLDNRSDAEIIQYCIPLYTEVDFKSVAYREGVVGKEETFFNVHGEAVLTGFTGQWDFNAYTRGESAIPLWDNSKFIFSEPEGRDPQASLLGQIVLDVDVSDVDVCPPEVVAIFCDDPFTLFSYVAAEAWNWRGREAGAAAYIRDPINVGGAALRVSGFEATNNPLPLPVETPAAPVPCTGGPDPEAGVLQFSADTYAGPEGLELAGGIMITRTQGSRGKVSAEFSTAGGSAVAGTHYTPKTTTVLFADGDSAPRLVDFTVRPDERREPDRTVNLALSRPGGCAVIGAQSSAVFTIRDDEPQPPTLRFTVGGTVVGLLPTTGSNLVLENHSGFLLEIFAPGPFTFTSLPSPQGTSYFVRVFNQPRNSLGNQSQQCTVTNGRGVIGTANVTDVLVTCTDNVP